MRLTLGTRALLGVSQYRVRGSLQAGSRELDPEPGRSVLPHEGHEMGHTPPLEHVVLLSDPSPVLVTVAARPSDFSLTFPRRWVLPSEHGTTAYRRAAHEPIRLDQDRLRFRPAVVVGEVEVIEDAGLGVVGCTSRPRRGREKSFDLCRLQGELPTAAADRFEVAYVVSRIVLTDESDGDCPAVLAAGREGLETSLACGDVVAHSWSPSAMRRCASRARSSAADAA